MRWAPRLCLFVFMLCACSQEPKARGALDAAAPGTAADGGGADAHADTSADASADAGLAAMGVDGSVPAAPCDPGCTSACVQGCFDLGSCKSKGTATLRLHPNVVTLGVVMTLSAAPVEGTLFYRKRASSTWSQGQPLVRIPDGRLAGSAFSLSANTAYELRVVAGNTVACGSATTQSALPAQQTKKELWVEASAAAGGTGTSAAPLRTLSEAIALAGPGVDIHVRAGVYRESVTITQGGAAGSYLRLLGEPGAVLDGADTAVPVWKNEGSGVYSTAWSGDPRYVSRDALRLYHYLSLADLQSSLAKNAEPMPEGFFVDSGRLYVRTTDAPDTHVWQIPKLNTAIQISGAAHVWIQHFEVRFYGEGDYAKGIDITDAASDIVVRANHVHDIPTLIWVRKGSSGVRIEDNELHQSSVFDWPWDAAKATDHENDAITLAGGEGAIVARNLIHDIFNGVYVGSFDDDHNPALAFDVDVYDNRLSRIGDDGLEPEGADVNARFWNNDLHLIHNGLSLAPITYGPVWAIRNRFVAYQESGFKVSNDTSARVWLLHNTCFTDTADHNGMNVSGPFENLVFRNNLIRGTSYSIESGQTVSTNDLDYDALFTTRGAPRIKWNDVRYDDLAALCAAEKLECHGVDSDPLLLDPSAGRFAPTSQSPLVDAALRLYGINDVYAGTAPDIGYVELGDSELPLP